MSSSLDELAEDAVELNVEWISVEIQKPELSTKMSKHARLE